MRKLDLSILQSIERGEEWYSISTSAALSVDTVHVAMLVDRGNRKLIIGRMIAILD